MYGNLSHFQDMTGFKCVFKLLTCVFNTCWFLMISALLMKTKFVDCFCVYSFQVFSSNGDFPGIAMGFLLLLLFSSRTSLQLENMNGSSGY